MKPEHTWNEKLKIALLSHGYDLLSSDTISEISTRTGLSTPDVTSVLEGTGDCTVKALIAIAEMLNLPPAELLNSTTTLVRVYSVDGGNPVVVALPRDIPEVSGEIGGKSLLYARNLDGSFSGLHEDAIVICSRDMGKPSAGRLYLLESDVARFVRYCISVNTSSHEATLSDEANTNGSYTVVRYAGLHKVGAHTPTILGEVLYSILQH